MLLQEPLLVVVALYIMFLAVVVIVRLDFSITKVAHVCTATERRVLTVDICVDVDFTFSYMCTVMSS